MAILIDLSQVVLGACYAFKDDLSTHKTEQDRHNAIDLIRHVILSQLKYYNTKYKQQYGKLIVCCDGKNYWRKKLFPYYKANRKNMRNKIDLDWSLIFETINQTIDDLRENFLFPVIRVDYAESDDVIATITKYLQDHEMIESPMFDSKQEILIVSSDKDFVQLQCYENVKQISPVTKRFVDDPDPAHYLAVKVLRGDKGDGICNVLSDDDTYVAGKKSPKMTQKRIDSLLAEGYDNCSDPTIKRNWNRNRTLIDFAYIPSKISNRILEEYCKPLEGNKQKIFDYLIKHQCNLLLNDINGFVN